MGHLGDHRAVHDSDGGVADRTNYPHVEVDVERVRASGLIKDEIGLDEPDEKGAFGSTLLREAVDRPSTTTIAGATTPPSRAA